LYLGGQEATSEKEALQMLSVTHLINVTKELPHHFPGDFSYFQVPVNDSVDEDIAQYFKAAHEFLDTVRSGGGVALVRVVFLTLWPFIRPTRLFFIRSIR
jgi:hypothetical protein